MLWWKDVTYGVPAAISRELGRRLSAVEGNIKRTHNVEVHNIRSSSKHILHLIS